MNPKQNKNYLMSILKLEESTSTLEIFPNIYFALGRLLGLTRVKFKQESRFWQKIVKNRHKGVWCFESIISYSYLWHNVSGEKNFISVQKVIRY